MPHARYKDQRMTLSDLLEAVDSGAYIVDLRKGTIVSRKTGKELFQYNDSWPPRYDGHWFVRLYRNKKMLSTSKARIIWMVGYRRDIPTDCEIHHDDDDPTNDSFNNLICVYCEDHKKIHNNRNGKKEEIPF